MPIEDLPTPMDEFQKSPSASESSNSLDNVPSISSSSSNSVGGGSGGRVGGGGGDTNHRRPNDRHFEYVPAVQPLIMQREPSLDELLREVSGSNDLRTLTEVHLKIRSNMVCIQRLDIFLPQLVSLNLDGSILNSLRDLGTNLSVKYLNVSRCGLNSLDGTNGLQTLVHLVADDNRINGVGQICNLHDLQRLSLRGNRIRNIDSLSFVSICPELRDLDLTGNPVCRMENYRNQLKESIPQLKILDDVAIYDEPREGMTTPSISSPEFSSSWTSSLTDRHSLTSGNSLENGSTNAGDRQQPNRPISAAGGIIPAPISDITIRPATSDSIRSNKSLTSGPPICGSIVVAARRRDGDQRPLRRRLAWTTSKSNTSVSSSTSSEFPNVLPQQSVQLELGVIGVLQRHDERTSTLSHGVGSNEETFRLLQAARKWRQASRLARENATE